MQTRDFFTGDGRAIDRLSAVKAVLSEFLARRTQDRSGLIVFGSRPYVQVPFTQDQTVIHRLLADTEVRMAGPRTMIGDAVGLAITLFERSKTPQRVLILLTDGNDTGSLVPPRRAAEIARDRQITIYTIGVGDPAAAGEEALDTETLASMAATTGGRFFMANDREELQKISREIDRLTPQQVNTLSERPRRDLFQWPLGLAFIITLLYHGSGLLLTQVQNLPLFPRTTRE